MYIYNHKTDRRLSKETRKKMSEGQKLTSSRPDVKLRRSLAMTGINSSNALVFTCFNKELGIEEKYILKKGLKDFCKKHGFFMHVVLRYVNKDQKICGWSITSKRLRLIEKDQQKEQKYKFYVYIYLDPRKPGKYLYENCNCSFLYEPFYVGKGGKGDHGRYRRWKQHIQITRLKEKEKTSNLFKYNKIKNILDQGLEPFIVIYERFEDESKALEMEKFLIKAIGRKDLKNGPLTNFTDGGEGLINVSEETRRRMSESQKGRVPWNRFKTISDEEKNAISFKVSLNARQNQKPLLIDTRPIYVIKKKERVYKFSEEARRNMSLAKKEPYNKGKKSNKPAWNKGLKLITERRLTEEQKINCRKNSVLNQPVAQYTIDNKLVATYQSQRDAARITGYKPSKVI